MSSIAFRSEVESAFEDSDYRSPLTGQDVPLFYTAQYEEDLLMSYIGRPTLSNVDSEESPFHSSETDNESLLNFGLPSDFLDFQDDDQFGMLVNDALYDPLLSDVTADFDTSATEENTIPQTLVIKPEPTFEDISIPDDEIKTITIHSKISPVHPYSRPVLAAFESDIPEKPTSRRGRPMKSTSNSKMAGYARAYREQKKEESKRYAQRVYMLEAENTVIRQENVELADKFNQLAKDYEDLKMLMEQDPTFKQLLNNSQ